MTEVLYSDVENSLRESVRATLARAQATELTEQLYDAPDTDASAVWQALGTDLGLAGLIIPEELGGAGATLREAGVVLQEVGRAVAPVPFLTSSVMAVSTLLELSDSGDARQLLGAIGEGSDTACLVVPWSAATVAEQPDDGVVRPVAGALEASAYLVPVTTDEGFALRLCTADQVTVEALTSLDMSRQLATVTPSGGVTLATGGAALAAVRRGLHVGQSLLASEQYGLASWCLETTVAYVKERVQFARPIGSFQGIKHRLADLYLEVTQAQAAARYASATLADSDPDHEVARSIAQSYCSDVAVHAAEEAVQLHGGIGMTWEHDLHLRLKRAKACQLALGTPAVHRAQLGELVGLSV